MFVSIVIPVFNESESLRPLLQEIRSTIEERGLEAEVLFVDDGSADGSWSTIRELVSGAGNEAPPPAGPRVRGILFPANRGKSAALAAGLAAARGQVLVTLDADLQDDPAELPLLLAALDQGLDLVVGWKHRRQDARSRLVASRLFNLTVSALTGVWLHDHNCGFKAMRPEVLPVLRLDRGMHRYMTVMAKAAGLRVGEVRVNHRHRRFGRSKYGLMRVPKSAFDLVRLLWRTRWVRRAATGAGPQAEGADESSGRTDGTRSSQPARDGGGHVERLGFEA